MGTKPEELKADIAERRRMMSEELEAIGDRVSPGQIVDRRRAAVRQRVSGWRETVMGAPGSGSNRSLGLSDRASNVGGQISDAPDALRRRAEGSPLGAGLIVFGAGLLVASVLPESESERQAAENLQPQLESAAAQARDMGQQVAETAKSSATDAAQELKSSATDATQTVKQQASDAGSEVKEHATDAARQVRQEG
jgi:hypothetical protein